DDDDDDAARGGSAGLLGHRGQSDQADESDLTSEDDEPRGFDPLGPEREPVWDEWPDRYCWEINIRAGRLDPMLRALLSVLPGRIYPILDVMGADAYREIDPYLAYELVGVEHFMEGLRRFRGFLLEDGMVGFGAMSDEPFVYVFVDEHKVITVRAEVALREKVEAVLAAFDLEEMAELASVDSVEHEHRGVVDAPPERHDLLAPEEIVEDLRDMWALELNIDLGSNLDQAGNDLGVSGWRCWVRTLGERSVMRYAEVLVTAENIESARDLAAQAVESLLDEEPAPTPAPTAPTPSQSSAPPIASSPPGPPAGRSEGPDAGAGSPAGWPDRRAPRSVAKGEPRAASPEPGNAPQPDDADGEAQPGDAEGFDRPAAHAPRAPGTGGAGGAGHDDDPPSDEDAPEIDVVYADRMKPEDFAALTEEAGAGPGGARRQANAVVAARWADA
ncbi:MAG: hypothetical protein C0468_07150, partial [Planctomyces sp.]|nr:hypothetical protein [Planctomyces sp.]